MTYKVERLGVTGALSCCFEHGGRVYSAQVDCVPFYGAAACTICPENGFDELYTMGDVPLTEAGLISCIEQGSMYFFVHEKLQRQVALRETTLRGCREVLRSRR